MAALIRRIRIAIAAKSPNAITASPLNNATIKVKPFSTNASKREAHLQKLVDRFKKSCDDQRFRHNKGIYARNVRLLAAANQPSLIEDVLEHQKRYADIRHEGFALRLIGLYGQAGMLDHARRVFDELPELGCPRTVKSFNALLKATVVAKKLHAVAEMFRELPSSVGIEPDVISYNTVIHALCEMGSYDEAIAAFRGMESAGTEPSVVTFNTLLNSLYRNGRFSEGESLWGVMESKSVVPTVRSYNLRLRGMFLEKKVAEAVELVGEMESKGVRADVFTYNALIRGFCDGGSLEEAMKWYDELRKSECKPSLASTYLTLIPACCAAGDLDKASELCLDAAKYEVSLNTALIMRVVDGLVEMGKTDEASKLRELVKSSE